MKTETLYISPLDFALEDTQAIQAAVDTAEKEDIQVVAIQKKPDGTPWHLTAPIVLPSYMTAYPVEIAGLEAVGFGDKVMFRRDFLHKLTDSPDIDRICDFAASALQ